MEIQDNVSTPLLIAEDLTIGYANVPLLSNLNLKLRPGELVCFMGPNGVGKSSLIKTLIKLLPPLSGSFMYSETGPI